MPNIDTSTVQSAEDGLSPQEVDEVVSLLQVAERRRMLHALVEYGELPLADLIDEVAWRMQDGRSTESAEQDGQVRVALVHNHLPRVADAGVVRIDQRRQTVALVETGAKRDLIDQLCSVIDDHLSDNDERRVSDATPRSVRGSPLSGVAFGTGELATKGRLLTTGRVAALLERP